jgi:hypothetical protein
MAAELTVSTTGDPYWNGSPSPSQVVAQLGEDM